MSSLKKAHHEIRKKLYDYAQRGGLRPLLEKGGILQDHVILVATDLAYEADESLQNEPCRKLAWDVKVIDACDVDRYSAKDHSPLGVADACREWCLAYNERGRRCAERHIPWRYSPIVFTVQGHLAPEAEAVISLLAVAVSQMESKDVSDEDVSKRRAEILRSVSASLPRPLPEHLLPASATF